MTFDLMLARTWPVKLAKQVMDLPGPIILEVGYGPSGLPHLGTATELIRTAIVADVLRKLTNKAVSIIAFCDDMDGMRKVPPNLPNQEMLASYIGQPLSSVHDPNGVYRSFAESNIQQLGKFIDTFGYEAVDYVPTKGYSQEEMLSLSENSKIVVLRSSDCYKSGSFNSELLAILNRYRDILDVVLPTLGEERRATYSPFMPISRKTGRVLEVGVKEYYPETGEILYIDEGEEIRAKVDGQMCKLQWKVDFGMRWKYLRVDFEMSGKDIEIGTNPIARQVCKILGREPPVTWMYEMFLAADGSKMSKTKGNGVSINEMLRYMPVPAIRHYVFLSPEKAKSIDITKMPKYIDDFLHDLARYDGNVENPVYYTKSPEAQVWAMMTLHMILGLNIESPTDLIAHLEGTIGPLSDLDKNIVECMCRFYKEHYKKPDFTELSPGLKKHFASFINYISDDADTMQTELYRIGNEAVASGIVADLKSWFEALYRAIFGQDQGRRLGNFFAMCGQERAREIVKRSSGM